ncbi:MAG: ABC transporter permease [Dehalococcoidia bacterium]
MSTPDQTATQSAQDAEPPEGAAATTVTGRSPARRVLDELRQYGVVAVLVVLVVVMASASPEFLSLNNLANILDQWAPIGITAVAGTLVIISGGFDLSSSAIYAFAGVAAALVTNATGSVVVGFAAGIGLGLALGIVNGVVTTAGRVNPFMTTLASSLMIRGVATAVSAGALISVTVPGFTEVGLGTAFGLGWSVWIFFGVVAAGTLLSRFTVFGRHVYAVGGNIEAARLSGVRVDMVRATAFALSGLACGIAGVIVASRGASGQAGLGIGIELTVIAAIVIGGTSILGGEGAVWRTVVGVLLLAVIANGFNLMSVEPVYQNIFQGLVILIAVGVDGWSHRK